MRNRNSYYDIAKEDIAMLKENENSKRYNNLVWLCNQACVKLLKSVTECTNSKDTEYRQREVHNIHHTVYAYAKREGLLKYGMLSTDLSCANVCNPGDNFIIVTKEMADKARACVETVEKAVDEWRASQGLPVYDVVDEDEAEADLAELAENI